MKYFFILSVAAFLFVACSGNISEVKPGMSSAEVEKILGKANQTSSSSSSSSVNDSTITEVSTAEWKYNGKGTVNFENDKVVSVTKGN